MWMWCWYSKIFPYHCHSVTEPLLYPAADNSSAICFLSRDYASRLTKHILRFQQKNTEKWKPVVVEVLWPQLLQFLIMHHVSPIIFFASSSRKRKSNKHITAQENEKLETNIRSTCFLQFMSPCYVSHITEQKQNSDVLVAGRALQISPSCHPKLENME